MKSNEINPENVNKTVVNKSLLTHSATDNNDLSEIVLVYRKLMQLALHQLVASYFLGSTIENYLLFS